MLEINGTKIEDITETVRQARGGNTEAFARIVRRYQSLVSGVLFSMTGDFHKSEDLAQETFLIAWHKLAELRQTDHLSAWLCTIARNLAYHSNRKPEISTDPLTTDKISSDPGPETELLRREQSELVRSAIGGIEEPYRETLVLYYRSDRSVKEIAEATASSEQAVRQRLVRARKSLKSKLEQIIGDILADTAPDDLFTYGVMTAISGGAVLLGTGTTLAGTTTLTAVPSATAATTAGSAGISLSTTTAIAGTTVIGSQAVAMGTLWASIRNTPTLRSRRFLVYLFFQGYRYLGWFLVAIFLPLLLFPKVWWPYDVSFAPLLIVMPVSVIVTHRNNRRYRRLIEHELGIPGPAPKEYSFRKVERQFYSCLVSNLLLLETLPLLVLFSCWYSGTLENTGSVLWAIGMFSCLGPLMLAYVYGLGKGFLEMCRTRASFLKTPPLIKEPLKTALQSPERASLVDSSGRMAWLNSGFSILLIPFIIMTLPMHPIALGGCIVALFLGLWFGRRRLQQLKTPREVAVWRVAGDSFVLVILFVMAMIECGGLSFDRFFQEVAQDHLLIGTIFFAILLVLSFLPAHLLIWLSECRKARQDADAGRAEALEEAIKRFDPMPEMEEEPVAVPQRLSRRWAVLIVLYGIAVVATVLITLYDSNPEWFINLLV